jgi:Xaa-Pro aminopeptidase
MSEPPFDSDRLDRLMDAESIDWILASSEHNTRYLLGGYSYFFHEHAAAIGVSRYLPLAGYPRGESARAFYVGSANESWQMETEPIWISHFEVAPTSTRGAATVAARVLSGARPMRVGIEPSFLPSDAMAVLAEALPRTKFVDATSVLEDLRAIKRPRELQLLRRASQGIVDSMTATFAQARPGISKDALTSVYRGELAGRNLSFDYAFITTGKSLNRAPFGSIWEGGQMLSFDSGGRFQGYVGDLCRMAVMGPANATMITALDEVAAVQSAAREMVKPGTPGRAIYDAARRQIGLSSHSRNMRFVAHGMGLITHEAPRLTDRAVAPYDATHFDKLLQEGMVLSVETHIADPNLGFVKLEDTLFVTADGHEVPGGDARGWNIAETG